MLDVYGNANLTDVRFPALTDITGIAALGASIHDNGSGLAVLDFSKLQHVVGTFDLSGLPVPYAVRRGCLDEGARGRVRGAGAVLRDALLRRRTGMHERDGNVPVRTLCW